VGWLEKERKSPESKKQRKLQCKKGNEAKSKKRKLHRKNANHLSQG
jgi:hypothetical protein